LLLARVQRLFLSVNPSRVSQQCMVDDAISTSIASINSSSVASGCCRSAVNLPLRPRR
jgi:hypothetical protein